MTTDEVMQLGRAALGMLAVAVVIILAVRIIFSINPNQLVSTLLGELPQAWRRQKATGSANIYALLAIFVFGLIIIMGDLATEMFSKVSRMAWDDADIGESAPHVSLSDYIGPEMYFFALLFFAIFSVIVVSRLEK